MIDQPIDHGFFAHGSLLVTGGTGSFGTRLVLELLKTPIRRIAVFSRDELKQSEMRQAFPDPRIRWFLGDVRDGERLRRAFEGVEMVVHAAALKQVPAAEYNPFEAVKTNILGAQNVIEAAIDAGVGRVIALSSDKASSPSTLYGATKLVSDRLFVAGNAYVGHGQTRFSVVRYGNVLGSRGSLVELLQRPRSGPVELTDERMTRFWLTLGQAVRFACGALQAMRQGEVFVPKLPSMRVQDVIAALAPPGPPRLVKITGIRPGEKLHEELIGVDDRSTRDLGSYYVIGGRDGTAVPDGFSYRSDANAWWLDAAGLRKLLEGESC